MKFYLYDRILLRKHSTLSPHILMRKINAQLIEFKIKYYGAPDSGISNQLP